MFAAPATMLDRIPVGEKATPNIPKEFRRLWDLAYNLWWSWDPAAYDLWSRIDPRVWAATGNPINLLQLVEESTWDALAGNASFTGHYERVVEGFDHYLNADKTWFTDHHDWGPIAYLCAEFGLNDKLPFYSGGLGVLAGDHIKAASDLGVPLVAIGLLYRRGYFRQAVDPDGLQQHTYLPVELSRRPLRRVLDPHTGRPLIIPLLLRGRQIAIGVWRIDVGRVPLLLLDTDIPENDPADRPITHVLYVRGREMRFSQEAVLGVGAARAVKALDLEPAVWHVNEGHSALSLVERIGWERTKGEDISAAAARIREQSVFTLHTPVPAGNEVFDRAIAAEYLESAIPNVDASEIISLGDGNGRDSDGFDMGALAIRLSRSTNGVSRRHAEIVTSDWGDLIGGEASAVTNGIHPPTWVGRSIAGLLEASIGADWVEALEREGTAEVINAIPNDDLWRAHLAQKELMLRRLRGRIREQSARHGDSPRRLRWVDDQLPLDRLTIVFARRFASYKRSGLIFSDPARIASILRDEAHPVQIVFAGKAHPADREGQGLVRWVVEMSRRAGLEGHVFYVENYDMRLAGTLVTGADVWLNNPRPPKEASGTSGMKAAANGGLNLSVLDGWWIEGHDGANGWGFGGGPTSDFEDAAALYHLLETEVVPRFYDIAETGVPGRWVTMMKRSMITALSQFTAQRMVTEYTERIYLPRT